MTEFLNTEKSVESARLKRVYTSGQVVIALRLGRLGAMVVAGSGLVRAGK